MSLFNAIEQKLIEREARKEEISQELREKIQIIRFLVSLEEDGRVPWRQKMIELLYDKRFTSLASEFVPFEEDMLWIEQDYDQDVYLCMIEQIAKYLPEE